MLRTTLPSDLLHCCLYSLTESSRARGFPLSLPLCVCVCVCESVCGCVRVRALRASPSRGGRSASGRVAELGGVDSVFLCAAAGELVSVLSNMCIRVCACVCACV